MQPDAVQDILLDDRYEGMMSTIDGLTGIVDSMFMTVITFVAFFIISVALLRNVLAGAYCAFPKFWDQVARAHEENENKAFFEEIKGLKDSYKTASMGSIKTFFFRIVPNIKTLTDFEDNTLSPKSYFIKAIPQMIGVVIIGVFIYNGYYRDFTAIVANTGAELLQRVVLDTDPMEIIDTFLNTAGRPSFATDNAIDDYGKNKNKIAVGIYQAIISKYPDITDANAKAELAADIDAVVEEMFPVGHEAANWFGNDTQFKITVNCELSKLTDSSNLWEHLDAGTLVPDADKFRGGWIVGIGKDGSGFETTSSGLSNFIRFDSVKDAIKESWTIKVDVTGERNATVTENAGQITATLTVPQNEVTNGFTNISGVNDTFTATVQSTGGKAFTIKAVNKGESLEPAYGFYFSSTDGSYDSATDGTEFTGSFSFKVTDSTTGKKHSIQVTKVVVGSALSISGESNIYTIEGSGGGAITVTEKKPEADPASTTTAPTTP